MRLSTIIILICFVMIHHANASELSWEYKDWSVSRHDNFVRYITNGDTVHGHQFGFIKMAGNCNQDLLWISWSTYEKGIKSFKGKDTAFQFRVGDSQFQMGVVPLLRREKR